MKFLQKYRKKIVVTHNAKFHADDVFSVAALSILFDGKIEVIRTRDEKYFADADVVLDVGMKHDGECLFDHHQPGGAGERENGIQYAAFGLIWKKFGRKLVQSDEAFMKFDQKIVQIIDADDNGKKIFAPIAVGDVKVYGLPEIVDSFNPLQTTEPGFADYDEAFLKAVTFVRQIIVNEIRKIDDAVEGKRKAFEDYAKSEDKRFVVQSSRYSFGDAFDDVPELLYVVGQRGPEEWAVVGLRKDVSDYSPKKPFPEAWAGKRGEELEKITGVKGARFCHRGRFVVFGESRESAIALTKLALQ